MQLFLVRHAAAEPRRQGRDDSARPLTATGKKKFRQVVGGLEALGIGFDQLLHSPWLRAVETADLLAPLLDGERRVSPGLASAPTPALLRELTGERIALVGHEPWMGDLLAWLTVGEAEEGRAFLFKKGGVAWIEGDPRPGRMVMRALLPPKVLAPLRRSSGR